MIACSFSPNRRYRYTLWRNTGILTNAAVGIDFFGNVLDNRKMIQFICLNPSTADDKINDPTIRRCVEFAARWNYDLMLMTNLFAFRATNPLSMKEQDDPVGPDNDYFLAMNARKADKIVLAWGIHGDHRNRDKQVVSLLQFNECGHKLFVFGFSRKGHPVHPLYQARSTELQPFRAS
jgi:hypothetical protein